MATMPQVPGRVDFLALLGRAGHNIEAATARGIDPMVVIRWKDVFERLEEAIDACERVARLLEGSSVKRA